MGEPVINIEQMQQDVLPQKKPPSHTNTTLDVTMSKQGLTQATL